MLNYRDPSWLREHYVDKKLSTKEVGRKAGVGEATIWRWLHKLNIPLRPSGGPRFGWERKTTIKASVRPTPQDVAWAAGFIEGEGHMRRRGINSSEITAAQRTEEPIRKLQRLFGGHVTRQKTYHPLDRAKPLYHIWVWRANGSRARGIIFTIYTFLSERRRAQAQLAV